MEGRGGGGFVEARMQVCPGSAGVGDGWRPV